MYKKALFVIFVIFFVLRLIGLGSDLSNSDAIRWYLRSANFSTALKQFNFAETYQHYQPGVTLMWINSVVKQFSEIYLQIFYPQKLAIYTLENTDWFVFYNKISVASLVIVLGIILFVQIYLIKDLYSKKSALLYGFFMAVEPYMIGIDRWFHLTSLEAYFGFLAFLFLLFYLKRSEKKNKKILIFSAFCLAISILSKITSLTLIPLFVYLLYTNSKKFQESIFFVIFTLIFVYIFFPALWVSPLNVISQLVSAANDAVTIKTDTNIFYYTIILLFKISPVLFFAAVGAFINYKNRSFDKRLVLYFIYDLILLSIAQKKIDRYVLIFIPPLILIASNHLASLKTSFIKAAIFLAVLTLCYTIYNYGPVYSAYYSPFFGGTANAVYTGFYDNSGEYFAQAAEYLNSKGRDIYTSVPDNIDSFRYFYKGKLVNGGIFTNYIVRSLDTDRKTIVEPDCPTIDKTFGPKDFAVVYVFKCQ